MNRRALDTVNTILFVFAITGTNIIDLFNWHIGQTEKILVSVILIIIYILVVREKKFEKTHSFKEDSKAFSAFFSKWYSYSGKLMIFCTDLEWLDKPEHAFVVNALKSKKEHLEVYLRNGAKDNVSKELIKAGAQFFQIKDTIKTTHRFSIRDDDGIQTIIIRNKDIKTDDIVFIETNSYKDPYLISMTLDLLDDCYVAQ